MPQTTNKKLEIPAHGTEVDTWDVPLNGNFTNIDAMLSTTLSKSLAGGANVTLIDTEMRNATWIFTGNISAANTIVTAPMPGFYTVLNSTSGGGTVRLRATAGGELVGLPPGEMIDVYSDGTDVRFRNIGRIGSLIFYYATALPTWINQCTVPPILLCTGGTFVGATYPALLAYVGSQNLPDFRSRIPCPLDNFGSGGAAGIINGYNTGSGTLNGTVLGQTGGSITQGLVANNLPTHTHAITITDPGHDHNVRQHKSNVSSGPNTSVVDSLGTGAINSDTDSATTGITAAVGNNTTTNTAHNNMQPVTMSGIVGIVAR